MKPAQTFFPTRPRIPIRPRQKSVHALRIHFAKRFFNAIKSLSPPEKQLQPPEQLAAAAKTQAAAAANVQAAVAAKNVQAAVAAKKQAAAAAKNLAAAAAKKQAGLSLQLELQTHILQTRKLGPPPPPPSLSRLLWPVKHAT